MSQYYKEALLHSLLSVLREEDNTLRSRAIKSLIKELKNEPRKDI